jgi:putative cofactor-binding repeat protein
VTHAELVTIARRWLWDTHQCRPILTEPSVEYGESPDAVGWKLQHHQAMSIVVECKVSRNDFLADRQKPSRMATMGVGAYRYYLTPDAGIIGADDLQDTGWGLLVAVDGNVIERAMPNAMVGARRDWPTELRLMGAAACNLERKAGREANDARPCNDRRLSEQDAQTVSGLVLLYERLSPVEIARRYMPHLATRYGSKHKARNVVLQAAERGEIPNVTTDGLVPASLIPINTLAEKGNR